MALVVALGLNAPSTAHAATRCVVAGTHAGGARGFVVARPHHSVLEHVAVAAKPCATTVWVDPRGGPLHAVSVVGPGWSGTIHSHATRVDGLIGAPQLANGDFRGGGHANLERLERRLDHNRSQVMRVRILLATILITLALFAPRRVVTGAAAAIASALLLSALGWTSLTLLGLLTLAGAFLPWRALWLFFAAYLLVLVLSPGTQSLALVGPHPWAGGRFYGMSNELETLVLAPALVLGLAAAPLVLLTVGWSRAGADGGGLLVLLAAYAWLTGRPRAAALAALGLAVLFVLADAATGGSSHVTHSVLHGTVFHDFVHRWRASWHGLTGTWGRVVQDVICIAALVWVATRRPRARVVDAFLLAIVVSLVANDTPQDVLFWGAITGVGLRRSV